jgi:hypothetical protein
MQDGASAFHPAAQFRKIKSRCTLDAVLLCWLAPKSLAGAYRVCTVGGTVGTRGLTLGVVVRAFGRDPLRTAIHHRYTASASLLALVCGRSISRCTIGAALMRSR